MNNELDNGQYQDFLFALFRIHVIVNSSGPVKPIKTLSDHVFSGFNPFSPILYKENGDSLWLSSEVI